MPDDNDPLRSAFEELRSSALPVVRPPGVSAVQQTVHRRRVARAGLAAAVVVACAGAAAALVHFPTSQPASIPAVAAIASRPSLAPSPLITPLRTEAQSTRPTKTHTSARQAKRSTPKQSCVNSGVAAYAVVDGSPGAKFTAVSGGSAVPCPGVTVPVTVAQYTFVDGVGTLTGTWTTSLDARHTRVAISLPPTCGTWLELYDVTEGALPSALTQGEIDDPQPGGGLWDGKRGHSAVVKNGVVPCPPQSPSGVPSGVPIS